DTSNSTALAQGSFNGVTYDDTDDSLTIHLTPGESADICHSTDASPALDIDAFDGNDTIDVNSTASAVTIFAGDGNDTINVGNGKIGRAWGRESVDGGNNTDAVNVIDNSATFSDTYTITSTTLTRAGFDGQSY